MSEQKNPTVKSVQAGLELVENNLASVEKTVVESVEYLDNRINELASGPGVSPVTLQQVDGNSLFEVVLGSVTQIYLEKTSINQLKKGDHIPEEIVYITRRLFNELAAELQSYKEEEEE